ncbi:ABC-2 type transport system permease protein [Paenarthrobacter nitroguajacolicus]|uniref:ABC transporter permease n=1 Tax=Paenarthrobacter nitroguajacolicus TaxID=211146 RepID=UPI00285A2085|nr:ABC-2 family transporter protein [Paenarthrobacter nitroguajacolicus]MDR6989718.1 ABC-2 type transport system permease protein [Paenarthrobacter nitroguajacolicus]
MVNPRAIRPRVTRPRVDRDPHAPVTDLVLLKLLVSARLRSQLAYRGSFLSDVAGQVLLGLTEFVELYAIVHNVSTFGGMTLAQTLLVFGLASVAFALGDLLLGETDSMSETIRSGKLEVLLVRPLPVLLQLATSDFQLRRVGRLIFAAAALVVALLVTDIAWDPAKVLLSLVTPIAGAAIFCALFLGAGAMQFWILDGRQFANAFTYGGRYVASMPGAALFFPVQIFFTFVIPATLVAYAPSLVILGLDGPAGIPAWTGWLGLPAAVVLSGLMLLLWRAAIKKYTGAGG